MSRTEGKRESALARLAEYYGIERGFRDARGEDIITSPATQEQLLRAMGLDATSEQKAETELARPQRDAAGSVLPPVIVTRLEDDCCAIELNAPPEVKHIAWRIALEDGRERRGTAVFSSTAAEPCCGGRIELRGVPWGYHRLHLPDWGASASLIVTPGHCWLPEGLDQGPGLWGIAVQLYLLRSGQNWGIGDFADLLELAKIAAQRGCQLIGLNPLHQMMLDNPEHASPYSPLTRLYLNVLYIAVPNAPGFGDSAELNDLISSPDFQDPLAACRAAAHVDYKAVTAMKIEALQLLFRSFGERPAEERQRFEAFRKEGGVSLRRSSTFQALRSAGDQPNRSRRLEEFRDANSDAVRRFVEEHGEAIDFLDWMQWVASEQLTAAADAAINAGMSVGLYRDLAVGCDRSGAETWTNPQAFLTGVQIGAPPDIFNPAGQNWGLPPFHPNALREEGYRSFIELIRANMRHAGGLRIDHVMGLQHLYCIPEGSNPAEGAYIRYPLDDLIGILALESQRQHCLVVGEDLGTVPEGFRERLSAANILSYRVLFFEQDKGSGDFLPPEEYPRRALAVAGSHDLPTLVGWWEGRDIDLKEELDLYPSDDDVRSQRQRREQDRAAILEAFRKEGLVEAEGEISTEQFIVAAHDFLAQSRSALVVPQLDDLLGEADQVNVPATSHEHPNWRRKYRITSEEISSDEKVWRLAGSLPRMRSSHRQDDAS